jgi:hypothetical protein
MVLSQNNITNKIRDSLANDKITWTTTVDEETFIIKGETIKGGILVANSGTFTEWTIDTGIGLYESLKPSQNGQTFRLDIINVCTEISIKGNDGIELVGEPTGKTPFFTGLIFQFVGCENTDIRGAKWRVYLQ